MADQEAVEDEMAVGRQRSLLHNQFSDGYRDNAGEDLAKDNLVGIDV